ncbi:MAG: DNA-3-methyladenine glycosylase I [Alphaproteobacteria bacterium]|nr:DNA-3-methyladenine glycosylase I [Alphaproteobacteria bacterium]MCD8571706.1 DNA-3-methyladenine glycosylase I [Alphaproteobacteria bacterium]
MTNLIKGTDNRERCWWCGDDPLYMRYHDEEWGYPVHDNIRLFEKICLEGFQSGLSWITILRKRENFRKAFDGFDYKKIARYGAQDVERLVQDAGIIRHRGKIEATINNAARAIEMEKEHGSLDAYFWGWQPERLNGMNGRNDIPSETDISKALSKDLKKRGWKFVGPTTCYAFMQAMGLVNDHIKGCHVLDSMTMRR